MARVAGADDACGPFAPQLLLEERLNAATLTQEVGALVELLWAEASGRLGATLTAPVEKLSLNDVSVVAALFVAAAPPPSPDPAVPSACAGEQGGRVAASGPQEAAGDEARGGRVPPGGGSRPDALQEAAGQGSALGVWDAGRLSGSPEHSRRGRPAGRGGLTLAVVQLIRDVLNLSEATLRSPAPSCLGKYRALRCSVEAVPADSSEFLDVAAQLRHR